MTTHKRRRAMALTFPMNTVPTWRVRDGVDLDRLAEALFADGLRRAGRRLRRHQERRARTGEVQDGDPDEKVGNLEP